MRRLALGALLVVVFASAGVAQVPVTGRMLGPNFPILVDSSGDGAPTPGSDIPIVPLYNSGNDTMTIPNPWEGCGPATHNVVNLTSNSQVAGGPYTGGSRATENQTETLVADQFLGARPTRFQMSVNKPGFPGKAGTGQLLDQNSDGYFDGLAGSGAVNFQLNLITSGDYVSIPWSQASALGVDTTDDCRVTGTDPQVWVPMADTNGDSRGDSIVLDLDGNNIPDPRFLWSPMLAAAAVANQPAIPTLSQWGLMLAALALAAAAWLQIRAAGFGA